jgi:5-methylthioadenosine/S-adenosylhomocysteine deaminase
VCSVPDGAPPVRRDAGPRDGGAIDEDTGGELDSGEPFDAGPRPDTGTSFSVTPGALGRILLRGAAVLTQSNGVVHSPGEVYVESQRIACVGAIDACAAQSGGATVIETGGVILPAFIDAHNHPAYNWLPEWTPGHLWNDARQWRGSSEYDAFSQPYSANSDDRARFCAMVQWGELRSLFSGATTVLGTGQPRTCFRWLVRNGELPSSYSGFRRDAIRSNTLGIDQVTQEDANVIIAAMNSGEVAAYAVHLGEGLTLRMGQEFDTLRSLGLLRAEAVIIHGTALGAPQFQEMGSLGAKLIWSPSSNYVLYGATTDVAAALTANVSVSLAPDWTPSGADDIPGELRFARQYLDDNMPGLIDDQRLVEMVTSIPAKQLGIDREVGSLENGLLADLLVLDVPGREPFREVIEARPDRIRLVLLGGAPSYGDADLMRLLADAPPSCHDLDACGAQKRACWTDTPDGPVSPQSIGDLITSFYPTGPLSLFDCR